MFLRLLFGLLLILLTRLLLNLGCSLSFLLHQHLVLEVVLVLLSGLLQSPILQYLMLIALSAGHTALALVVFSSLDVVGLILYRPIRLVGGSLREVTTLSRSWR